MGFYLVLGMWPNRELICCAVVYEESPEEAIRMVQNLKQQELEGNWQAAEFDGTGVVIGAGAGIYAWIS